MFKYNDTLTYIKSRDYSYILAINGSLNDHENVNT